MSTSFAEVFEAVQHEYGSPGNRRRDGEPFDGWISRLHDANRHFVAAELLRQNCAAGGIVADIGAWPGHFTVCLQRMGWSVIGVDKLIGRPVAWHPGTLRSETWIATDSSSLSFEALCTRENIRPVNVDIESDPLPFESDSVDAVVLTEVIEHLWRNPLRLLAEINRVLRPQTGALILSTPNLLSLRNRLEFLSGRIDRVIENPFVSFLKLQRVGHLGHLRLYAPAELLAMLHLCGFECTVRYERVDVQVAPAATGPHTEAGPLALRQRGRSISGWARRVFKTPRGYASAVRATLVDVGERRVPRFRGRIFITAKKVMTADFDRNYPAEIRRRIEKNVLP